MNTNHVHKDKNHLKYKQLSISAMSLAIKPHLNKAELSTNHKVSRDVQVVSCIPPAADLPLPKCCGILGAGSPRSLHELVIPQRQFKMVRTNSR